jgi:hypothetical protein
MCTRVMHRVIIDGVIIFISVENNIKLQYSLWPQLKVKLCLHLPGNHLYLSGFLHCHTRCREVAQTTESVVCLKGQWVMICFAAQLYCGVATLAMNWTLHMILLQLDVFSFVLSMPAPGEDLCFKLCLIGGLYCKFLLIFFVIIFSFCKCAYQVKTAMVGWISQTKLCPYWERAFWSTGSNAW